MIPVRQLLVQSLIEGTEKNIQYNVYPLVFNNPCYTTKINSKPAKPDSFLYSALS